jgi:hypothetical protein
MSIKVFLLKEGGYLKSTKIKDIRLFSYAKKIALD